LKCSRIVTRFRLFEGCEALSLCVKHRVRDLSKKSHRVRVEFLEMVRLGLDLDSDSEEDGDDMDMAGGAQHNQVTHQPHEQQPPRQQMHPPQSQLDILSPQGMKPLNQTDPFGRQANSLVASPAPNQNQAPGSLGMDAAAMHRMRASIFPQGRESRAAASPFTPAVSLREVKPDQQVNKFPVLYKTPDEQEISDEMHSPSSSSNRSHPSDYEPPMRRLFKRACQERERDGTVVLKETSVRPDAGLFMGSCRGGGFRCSWGPNGELVFPSGIGKDGSGKQTVTIFKLPVLPNLTELEQIVETHPSTYVAELEVSLAATLALTSNVPFAAQGQKDEDGQKGVTITSPTEGERLYTMSPLNVSWEDSASVGASTVDIDLVFSFSGEDGSGSGGSGDSVNFKLKSSLAADATEFACDVPTWEKLKEAAVEQSYEEKEVMPQHSWCCVRLTFKSAEGVDILTTESPYFMILECLELPRGVGDDPNGNQLVKCMQQYRASSQSYDTSQPSAQHRRLVWELVNALFGQQEDIVDLRVGGGGNGGNSGGYEGDLQLLKWLPVNGTVRYPLDADGSDLLARRAMLREWFDNASLQGQDATHETSVDPLERIFQLLTVGEGYEGDLQTVRKAVECAAGNRDLRLATLLAQPGFTQSQDLVAKQVAQWKQRGGGSAQFIDEKRRRLYELISGDIDGAVESTSTEVGFSTALDWKSRFRLDLWYGRSASLTERLERFKAAAFKDSAGAKAVRPRVWYAAYAQQESSTSGSEHQEIEQQDVLFELLSLYADEHLLSDSMCAVVAPEANTPDHCDYRMSWHLYSVLEATGMYSSRLTDAQHTHIQNSYMHQLEVSGEWKWAVFVALHDPSPALRTAAVKQLLQRHCPSAAEQQERDYVEKERFLLERLHVPKAWLDEAKAFRAAYDKEGSSVTNELRHAQPALRAMMEQLLLRQKHGVVAVNGP
jgi:hypothetical protein